MKYIVALLMCLFSSISKAATFENWDTADKNLFVASEILIATDWAQTRQIANNPETYHETNGLLGEYPSLGKVDAYFTTVLIGNYFMADYIGSNRKAYFYGVIGLELSVIGNNRRIGLRIAF